MTEKEKTLIAGCLKGEKTAWDALVLQYSKLAYSTIRSTLTLHHALPQDDIVEDLHQDFFLGLCENEFRKLRHFKGERGCSLASWLRVIASRLTIDFLRRQDSIPASLVDGPMACADPSADFISREEERSVAQAIEALSPRDRLFVEICFRRSLPPNDIAGIFNVSIGAVYTQKSRILAKLREVLEKSRPL